MLPLIRDLFQHKSYADSALLNAVRKHEAAAKDQQLRELLHHIVAVQRYFLTLCQGESYDVENERRVPDTLAAVAERFRETQALEEKWIAGVEDQDLRRLVAIPFWKGRQIPVSEAMVQVCLHSHGHRAQCLTRLRMLGGKGPTLDYILWTKDRPAPDPIADA